MGSYIADVVVVGAGPYGLSIAAHLAEAGTDFRIFGSPMASWRTRMPSGMYLKSEGFASSISDPGDAHALRRYCAETGAPYRDIGLPVPIEQFIAYGTWFQKRLVPELEDTTVLSCRRRDGFFELGLATGEEVRCRRVVIATGLTGAARLPPELAHLPESAVSHSSAHHDLSRFRGREVVVLGAGQSALETAALLHETGAGVHLVARRKSLVWATPPADWRPLRERLRHPMSTLGPGMRTWAYAGAPGLFHRLPEGFRIKEALTVLGPAGGWWLRERVADRLPTTLGQRLAGAGLAGERVALRLQDEDGRALALAADHVIAATGYEVTLRSFPFLAPELRAGISCFHNSPLVSRSFESSVPGLYFVGQAALFQFGPVMRFVAGTGFAARTLVRHLGAANRVRDGAAASERGVAQGEEATIAR